MPDKVPCHTFPCSTIVKRSSCVNAVLRSAEDGNERDDLKGSCTACIALIDAVEVSWLGTHCILGHPRCGWTYCIEILTNLVGQSLL